MDGLIEFLESFDPLLFPLGWSPSMYRSLSLSLSARPLFFQQVFWFFTQNPTAYIQLAFQATAENKLQIVSLPKHRYKLASQIQDPILQNIEADLEEWLDSNPFNNPVFDRCFSERLPNTLKEVEQSILSWLASLALEDPAAPILISSLPLLIHYYQRFPIQAAPLLHAFSWAISDDRECTSSLGSSSVTTTESLSSDSLLSLAGSSFSSSSSPNTLKKKQFLTILLDAARLFCSLKARPNLPSQPDFLFHCVDVESRLRAFLSVLRYHSITHSSDSFKDYVEKSFAPFLILGPSLAPSLTLFSLYAMSLNSLAIESKKSSAPSRTFPSPLMLLDRMQRLSGLNTDFLLSLLRISGGHGQYPLNHLEDLRFQNTVFIPSKDLLPQLEQLSQSLKKRGSKLSLTCLPDLVTLQPSFSPQDLFTAAQNGYARFLKRLQSSKPSLFSEKGPLNIGSLLLLAAKNHQLSALQFLLRSLPTQAQILSDTLHNTILHLAVRTPEDRSNLFYTSLNHHEFSQRAILTFILSLNNPTLLLAKNQNQLTFLHALLVDLSIPIDSPELRNGISLGLRQHQLALFKIALPFLSIELLSIPNPQGDYPLHLALKAQNDTVGSDLVKHCLRLAGGPALFVMPNAQGSTALHVAVAQNNVNAVRRLAHAIHLEALQTLDESGLSPVAIAQQKGFHQTLAWLSGHEVERSVAGLAPHAPILQRVLDSGHVPRAVTLIQRGAQLSPLFIHAYPLQLLFNFAVYSNLPQWIEIYNQAARSNPAHAHVDCAQNRKSLETQILAVIYSGNQAKIDETPTPLLRQIAKQYGRTLSAAEKTCLRLTINDFTKELFQEEEQLSVRTTALAVALPALLRSPHLRIEEPQEVPSQRPLTFSEQASSSPGSLSPSGTPSSQLTLPQEGSAFKRRRVASLASSSVDSPS